MKNFQIGENLRDNRHGSHGHTDGKDDGERDAVAVWPRQRRPDNPWREDQAEDERQP